MSRALARLKLAAAADAMRCTQSNLRAAAEEMARDPHPAVQLDAATLHVAADAFTEMQGEVQGIIETLLQPMIPPTICQECG